MQSIDGDNFQRRQAWRSGLALRLRLLAQWCQSHALLNGAIASRLADIQKRLLSDDLTVGFVGEMARGKSELINAILFGKHQHRLLPVGPGQVTLCALEIVHAAEQPASLRLQPAGSMTETGETSGGICDGEGASSAWTELALEAQDTQQMARALESVCQKSAYWDATGSSVHGPRWRHAVLRLPLPLLEQGLHLVDTPGLNAPGRGAEHALNLLPSWDVIVLVLSADIGLTASELALWQDHLIGHANTGRALRVVLNKADVLWDPLGDAAAVQQQMHQQRLELASHLGIEPEHIFTVSAQKGFSAKATGDAPLLARSGLPLLESALFHTLLAQRQSLWRQSLEHAFAHTKGELEKELAQRRLDIARQIEQVLDRAASAEAATSKAAHDKEQDRHNAKTRAVQSILQKQMHKIRAALKHTAWERSLRGLESTLLSSAGGESVQKAYAEFQQAVRTQWEPIASSAQDIEEMLASVLPLSAPDSSHAPPVSGPPTMAAYASQLDQTIEGHLQYLGNSRLHQLKQADFTRELGGQLHNRIADIRRQMDIDFEDWHAQIQAHLQREIEARENAAHRQVEQNRLAAEKHRDTLAKLEDQDDELKALFTMLEAHFSNLQDANADY